MRAPLRPVSGRTARLVLLALLVVGLAGPPGRAAAANAPAIDPALLAKIEADADAIAADLAAFWAPQLAALGVDASSSPTLIVYTAPVRTRCGLALEPGVTTTGFFCPRDGTIYVDGVDNAAVATALGPGWLPTVVAHEWGHHVQEVLGLPYGLGQPASVSVRGELQADCFAGAWTVDADGRGLIAADGVGVSVYVLTYLGLPAVEAVTLG